MADYIDPVELKRLQDSIDSATISHLEHTLNAPPVRVSGPKFIELTPGQTYVVRVHAHVEYQQDAFAPVDVEFVARFTHWITSNVPNSGIPGLIDHARDVAAFDNAAYIGPRSNCGISWTIKELL